MEMTIMNDSKYDDTLAKRITYYVLGVIETLLAFRLVFKLLGANPDSSFVSFIYSVTRVFVVPFESIFSATATDGLEATGVLEPATIVAMVVYAVIAMGIIRLIDVIRGERR